MNTKNILSIVISYNDIKNTSITVESLLNQTVETKIVVWDNNSKDQTPQTLKKLFGDRIIVHQSSENAYWAPAINAAFSKYYEGEQILHYSNNDIYYPNESLERMVKDLIETDAGAVGPTGSAMGGAQDHIFHNPEDNSKIDLITDFYKSIKSRPPTRASSLVGACMVMKTKTWKFMGPLDNGMPLGADDFDFSIRVRLMGLPLYVCQSSYIYHVGHASGYNNKSTWSEIGAQSWAWFNKKWDGFYFNELEAAKCLWNHEYNHNWDYGTGWMDEESRIKVWHKRGVNYDGSPIH
jgi:GT2 family glycosyltransferase